jgi:hypothetical protein
VEVGSASQHLRKLVPAETLEKLAAQQYQQMLARPGPAGTGTGRSPAAAAPARHRPKSSSRSPRPGTTAPPVALGGQPHCQQADQRVLHARRQDCLLHRHPEQLKLTDDEAAMIMGHEMAHALREHARERIAKTQATNLGLRLGAQLLGLGDLGNVAANLGGQLLTLKFSRDDESEADLVGLELAARAAYQPAAGVSLWQKMGKASGGSGKGGWPFCPPTPRARPHP